jgi:hypothetical protein
MPIRLNGSTSGYTELSAPAVAGNNSITFPTTSGTAVVNGANSAIVSGTAVASTSGTSIDFTGIPSWVKRVTVMFNGVSQSGTSLGIIQLGDAGGVETSGYLGFASFVSTVASTNSFTSGFGYMTVGVAAEAFSGMLILALEDVSSNTWVMSGTVARSAGGNGVSLASGSKSLSGTLDRVRITTVNGTDTFDAGSINILYE